MLVTITHLQLKYNEVVLLIEAIRVVLDCFFFFFFTKRLWANKKSTKRKQVIFLLLDVFYAHKNSAFFVFCSPVCFLFAQNLFVKIKIKFKITLIASINNITNVHPPQPAYQQPFSCTYFYLSKFLIICENLFQLW